MAVQSTKMGPGQLSFGTAGTLKEFGVSIKNAVLEPSASDGEVIKVLNGDEIVDEGEETWVLKGTVLQGYEADSLIAWCKTNSGTTLPFTFKPSSAKVLKAAGNVLIRSIAMGGDVNSRATSDFSFKATNVAITTA